MKKIIFILLIIIFFIPGCKNKENVDGIIEVRERMFLGQVNDIYLNSNYYLGKTLKIEGMFMNEQNEDAKQPFYAVYRFGPGGCCGIDGIVGFEVAWMTNRNNFYPKDNEWVEAIGELKRYRTGANQYLYLDLTSLKVLDVRGKEYISQ